MSTRNFDSRVIIARLRDKNNAQNLYLYEKNGATIISNPQVSDPSPQRIASYHEGAQTTYQQDLLGGLHRKTISLGGIANLIGTTVNPSVPNPPINCVAYAGDQEAIITFSAPDFDGHLPIQYYTIKSSPGDFTLQTDILLGRITGLTNGVSYTFTVTATNAVGTSQPSLPSNAVTPSSPLATVSSVDFQPFGYATYMEFTGNVTSEGGAPVTERGVVWNTTGNPTTSNNKVPDASGGLGSYTIQYNAMTDEQNYARAYAINSNGTSYGDELTATPVICLAKDTLISLYDGSIIPIQEVTYHHEILVWNFDTGIFEFAYPLWIKKVEKTTQFNILRFSNNTELRTIRQHRIFNKQAGKFTYPMSDETPLGTITFTSSGEECTLVSKEIVNETVEYYNIITEYHINLFANGILTSCRYNNIYPIVNMQFDKDARFIIPYEAYENKIPQKYYSGLRLYEQTIPVKDSIDYVAVLEELKQ